MTRFATNMFAAVAAVLVMASSFAAITSVPANPALAAVAVAPVLA